MVGNCSYKMATQRKSVQQHKENLFVKKAIFASIYKGGNMLTQGQNSNLKHAENT